MACSRSESATLVMTTRETRFKKALSCCSLALFQRGHRRYNVLNRHGPVAVPIQIEGFTGIIDDGAECQQIAAAKYKGSLIF